MGAGRKTRRRETRTTPPPRYEKILKAMAAGYTTNEEIEEYLEKTQEHLARNTIKKYVSELCKFYNLDREGLVHIAQVRYTQSGFTFAGWVVKPVSIVAGNGTYPIRPVTCELSDSPLSLPVSDAEREQYILRWKKAQAEAGKKPYNGWLAHLDNWLSLEPTERELYLSLHLSLKETDYFTWQALTAELRDKHPIDPDHPRRWKLPVPLGIELVVVANADPEHPELLILKRTGKDIGPYPDFYTVSVTGFMNLEKDRDKDSGKPDIYKTLCREAKEELHLEEIEDLYEEVIWLALAIDFNINSAALLGMISIPKRGEELIGRIAQAKEGRHEVIPFTARDVAHHIWRFHNIWEPHGTVAVIFSLIYKEAEKETRGAQDRVVQAFAPLLSPSDRSSSR